MFRFRPKRRGQHLLVLVQSSDTGIIAGTLTKARQVRRKSFGRFRSGFAVGGMPNGSSDPFSDLQVRSSGKTILICRHHGTTPELANRLGAAGAPGHWKDSEFNRVWQIDYDRPGVATFHDLPRQLPEAQPAGK